ncbi:hypothetical protein GCM10023094_55760 [Rhodococcus olei]|uniref:Uncharacterized protein n=1 Tax=Rhodococcus olei TaxID=2161675 RepID=A0ABP8PSK3_9NOCA
MGRVTTRTLVTRISETQRSTCPDTGVAEEPSTFETQWLIPRGVLETHDNTIQRKSLKKYIPIIETSPAENNGPQDTAPFTTPHPNFSKL